MSEVDWERTACLCDAGLPGFVAAVAVDARGRESLWLVCDELLGRPDVDHGNPHPPHELVGPLPRRWRDLVRPGLRCGQPTASGRPCRKRLAAPDGQCPWHGKPVQR